MGMMNSYYYYLNLILSRKVFIISFTIAVSLITALISLSLPKTYEASATILPSAQQSYSQRFAELGQFLNIGNLSQANLYSSSIYPALLKSRFINERVLNTVFEFDLNGERIRKSLYDFFKFKNMDLAVMAMNDLLQVDVSRTTGIITISIKTVSPKLSADIVNCYIKQLNYFNYNFRVTNATRNKNFIEGRLREVEKELAEAEDELESFQLRNLNFAQSTDPTLMKVLKRYQRKVELKNQLYLSLAREYEMAKISVKREEPVLQVIDWAKPPQIKAGPLRRKMVLTAFIVALLLSIFWVVGIDYYRNQLDPEKRLMLKQLLRNALSIRGSS